MIFGTRPLIEAYRAGKEIEKIFLLRGGRSPQLSEVIQLAHRHGTPLQYVPNEKLNRLTRKNHQGVVAFMSQLSYQLIEQLIPMLYERGETPLILVLDRVTDVRNFGAIARTAEAMGVHALLLPTRGSATISADAVKTSAGALNRIAVCRAEKLKDTLTFLKESGLQIVAISEKSDRNIWNSELKGPVALLLGSEEDGVSSAYLKLADMSLRIPLVGETESLNVSVAAGMACYEVLKQRTQG